LKILKFVAIILVMMVVLYAGAILLGFNLPKPGFLNKSIEGEAVLKVTLLMDNNVRDPLANIEVDVAEKPGAPPKGGIAVTDESGVATFKIKSGTYYVFFNDFTFPKNLEMPPVAQVTVSEGAATEKTILMTTSK
jgi:hypothetical protein